MRIVIADDHPLVRSGVRQAILGTGQYTVEGEAQDGFEALALVRQCRPDLIILDLQMPGPGPVELAESLLECHPELKILVLSAHRDEAFLKRLKKIKLSGYLLKDEGPESLLQALRTITQGATWFSQSVVQLLLTINQSDSQELAHLTPRERSIVVLIAEGKDNATIAKELCLSEQTVRNYTSHIYQKIGASSRVEAILWALQQAQLAPP